MSLLIKALKQAETRHKLATADALAHSAHELTIAPAAAVTDLPVTAAAQQSATVTALSEPQEKASALPSAARPTLETSVLSIEPVMPVLVAPLPASIDAISAQQSAPAANAATTTAAAGGAKVVPSAAGVIGRGRAHRWFLSGVAGSAVLFATAWLAWAAFGRPAPMPAATPASALLPTAVPAAVTVAAAADDKPVASSQQQSASVGGATNDESARAGSSTAPTALSISSERGGRNAATMPNKTAMLSRSPQPTGGKSVDSGVPEMPATAAATRQATAAVPVAIDRRAGDASAIQFKQSEVQHDKAVAQLDAGYQALLNNDLGGAKRLYEQALALDRNSGDALIGLATIAARGDQAMQAERLYRRALEIDPNDADARAGLIALRRAADPTMQESALRGLVAQENVTASNHLALGNLLAAQGRWPEAQQSYFMATSADPSHPDYAFNLAISLDRMRQASAAIGAYRRAIELAQQRPARFTLAQAQARLAALQPGQNGGTDAVTSQQPSDLRARQEMPTNQGQLTTLQPSWHSAPINLQSVPSDHGR